MWKAEDSKAENLIVAIKIYAPDKGMDLDGIAVFSQEFSLVFNVSHQNLLRPTHFDVYEGSPFLVLPFCENGSTLKLIGSNPSERKIVHLLHDVAAGLEYLHRQNPPIIHQDIKPDNILMDTNGDYKITDFGISTRIRSTLRRSVGKESSAGTMAYMAPERFERNPEPIKASDIWSLGATVYEIMTTEPPFGNLGGVSLKSGADIPEVGGKNYSSEIKQLIEKCLSKDPWDRPTAENIRKTTEMYMANGCWIQNNATISQNNSNISDVYAQPLSENNEKKGLGMIIAGYIFAVLGGWLAIVFGLSLVLAKNKNEDGVKVYRYNQSARTQGWIIFVLSIISFIIWQIALS